MRDSKESFRDYILLEKKYSKLTFKAYFDDLSQFEKFVAQNFQEQPLEKVQYSIIRQWIIKMMNEKKTFKTINRKISSLNAFYLFLLKAEIIEINPLSKHQSLKNKNKIQIPYAESEIQNVINFEFSDDFDGLRDRIMIELFYGTGIRKSELINLTMQNVDLENRTIKVLGKRNKERVIPILIETCTIIENYIIERSRLVQDTNADFFMVSNKGVKLNGNFVYKKINYYLSAVSKKSKNSPHMLRHTYATHLLNQGADLNAIKELLGHSSLASTQIYTNSSLEALQSIHKANHPRNSTN